MGHAGISGNQVRGLEDSFSIVMMLVVYLIPFLLLAVCNADMEQFTQQEYGIY